MRRILIPILTALVLTVVSLHYSSGFSVSKILCELPPSIEPYQSLPDLSEPYTYLAHGRQSFVFQSADGKSVIKFFNQNYFQPRWYHFLPALEKWKKSQQEKITLRQMFYRESYPLALQEFPKETGLLYVHLHTSSTPLPSITLKDPTGRLVRLDLNRVAFVIQKKAKPYLTHLEEVLEKKGLEGIKEEIDCWINFCSKRIEKKISDYDHDIWQNVGALNGEILFIDPGKFYRNEQIFEKDQFALEWWKATHRLHHWLVIHHPAVACYLLEQTKKHEQSMITKKHEQSIYRS
jgi:hypothetical protein